MLGDELANAFAWMVRGLIALAILGAFGLGYWMGGC
jgi:hypothetical protein